MLGWGCVCVHVHECVPSLRTGSGRWLERPPRPDCPLAPTLACRNSRQRTRGAPCSGGHGTSSTSDTRSPPRLVGHSDAWFGRRVCAEALTACLCLHLLGGMVPPTLGPPTASLGCLGLPSPRPPSHNHCYLGPLPTLPHGNRDLGAGPPSPSVTPTLINLLPLLAAPPPPPCTDARWNQWLLEFKKKKRNHKSE